MSDAKTIQADLWLLPKIWAAFTLLLLLVTYKLWFPVSEIPGIPLVGTGSNSLSWVVSGLVAISLVAILTLSNHHRWLWWAVGASLIGLFVLDQHRLQPWAYQTAVYAIVFASMDARTARKWLVLFAVSVYLFSAIGKLDFQFTHTVGIDFLRTVVSPVVDIDPNANRAVLAKWAYAFPALECLAGLLLIPRGTRRFAGIAVMVMHLSLLFVLGPLGLNHSGGVLVWNVLLFVQAWFLFVAPVQIRTLDADNDQPSPMRVAWVARLAVLIAVAMPVSERFGYWDHWLSWALYSPHNSRVDVQIHRSAAPRLPEGLKSVLVSDDESPWQALAIDEWSLQQQAVPIYPQARYQLGLVAEIADRFSLDHEVRCKLRSVSDRRTGTRDEKLLLGRNEIRKELGRYWFVPAKD